MTGPIKVGDFVVQVRACCEAEVRRATEEAMCFGRPFVVKGLDYRQRRCMECGFKGLLQLAFGRYGGIYVAWLKRTRRGKR